MLGIPGVTVGPPVVGDGDLVWLGLIEVGAALGLPGGTVGTAVLGGTVV